MTTERPQAVLFGGKPMTLVGPQLKAGDMAPDVQLADHTLAPKRLSDFKAKARILSCVVSLDTGVCAEETHKFEQEVAKLGGQALLISISRDLPFAQGRFCGGNPGPHSVFLSDYASGAFGHAYGTWIKEVSLDCRAVFVVDAHNKIVHAQYVKDTPTHPDYAAVLGAVKAALGS